MVHLYVRFKLQIIDRPKGKYDAFIYKETSLWNKLSSNVIKTQVFSIFSFKAFLKTFAFEVYLIQQFSFAFWTPCLVLVIERFGKHQFVSITSFTIHQNLRIHRPLKRNFIWIKKSLCFKVERIFDRFLYPSKAVIPNRGTAAHLVTVSWCQGSRRLFHFLGLYTY